MCPLFLPAAAMPLTGLFTGECAAAQGPLTIPIDTLRECCNRGYARAACPRAATIEADAAQFLIKSDRGGVIEVAWALERNHHPLEVGTMCVSERRSPREPLARQVHAHAEHYRNQRGSL